MPFNKGEPVGKGEAVYISANNEVKRAIATALATSAVIGFCRTAVASATCRINQKSEIQIPIQFETSLTLAANDEVYLSPATAGALTNVKPTASGKVVKVVGRVADVASYAGTAPTDSFAKIVFVPEAASLIP